MEVDGEWFPEEEEAEVVEVPVARVAQPVEPEVRFSATSFTTGSGPLDKFMHRTQRTGVRIDDALLRCEGGGR